MHYTVYGYDEHKDGMRANEYETDYVSLEKAYDMLLCEEPGDWEVVAGERPGWKRVKCIAAYDDEDFQVEDCIAYREVAAL